MAIAIARWGSRIVNVSALAKFFKASEAGTEAAAAGAFLPLSQSLCCVLTPNTYLAAEEIAAEAEASEKTLQGEPRYRHVPYLNTSAGH